MLKKLIVLGSLFVLVCSAIFIINQTAQIVSLANTISPNLGRAVLYALLTVYVVVILVPIVLFIRLPKPMIPPADEQSAEYQTYLRRLGARLATNPDLACADVLNDRASIESALKVLDAKADELTKSTASILFVATAVSQSGRLDGLMVLTEQTRLIWRVAHIYNQRPTRQDLVRLYANVGTAVFAANALRDMDIARQIAPMITAAAPTIVHPGNIPGVPHLMPAISKAAELVADIAVNSIVEGTANAYLTLRVGIICRSYCRAITAVDRGEVHHNASIAAVSMLGSIVSGSAMSVISAIVSAAKKAGQSGVESAVAAAMKAWQSGVESAADGLRGAASKLNPFKGARED
jgi:hypothetical protein